MDRVRLLSSLSNKDMFSFSSRLFLLVVLSGIHSLAAQVTTGSLAGEVRAAGGEKLVGATVQLVHEPTGTAAFTRTNRSGYFVFSNLAPGGPYTLTAGFVNHTGAKKTVLVVLGEEGQVPFVLTPVQQVLAEVTVSAKRGVTDTYASIIDREKMERLPVAGRDLYQYLQTTPRARLVNGNEAAVSFGGQNNRYNAFYIDGAVNNDLFGLAASGTNGGQAGISPVAVEAIEQLQVSVSPYDASLGNFTGAAINAVTRAGSNASQTSLYHFFRNTATQDNRQSHRLYGVRTQGAFKKNRLFYCLNTELERNLFSRSFSTEQYQGKTSDAKTLSLLSANLLSNYGYDPGSFDHADDLLFADRISIRVDWKPSPLQSLTAGIRYTAGQRTVSNQSDAGNLYFSHSGYALTTQNTTGSLEWKTMLGKNASILASVTHTIVNDDRMPAGKPFPRVRIYDDAGSIIIGTDISSGINLLRQRNSSFTGKFQVGLGRHRLSAGVDAEYSRICNAFIQYALGSYSYASPGDFITNASPSGYQLGFSMIDAGQNDNTRAAANFTVIRGSLFVNDDCRISSRLSLQAGIRADRYVFPDKPATNVFFNDTVLPLLAQYHPLQGALTGNRISMPVSISPRLSLRYVLPEQKMRIRLGIGIFSGRMPFAWPGGVYQYNGLFTGGFTAGKAQLNRMRFRPDPHHPWMPAELGATGNKDPVNLVSATLRMPALARMSVSVEKNFVNDWNCSLEAMYGITLSGIAYRNVNLLPPTARLHGAGERAVYTDSNNARIPLPGGNPYGSVILLTSQEGAKGYSYEIGFSARKKWLNRWETELHYHWGRSFTVTDGTSSVNLSQWRTTESVNGRNEPVLSVSDFSPGHRIRFTAWKRFPFSSNRRSLTVSLSYTGQSGFPFSYVYGGQSLVRDDGRAGGFELLYIPSAGELESSIFLPLVIRQTVITPPQQKAILENYFQTDAYLRKKRGQFAERNGSAGPFMHTVDLKMVQELVLPGKKRRVLQLSCELANLANLLNASWGKKYQLPFGQLAIIDFEGYTGPTDLTPQYRLNPVLLQGPVFPESQSLNAVYGSNWSFQLGIRLLLQN
ncbi:TonB-dependent receptor [Sediminibacterium soli]|uniref:TonB-dependent receptor n=1 Tax=Sediminibacterium soli TaxID=2698829 RepID=UPI00137B92EB|nr:carboxypeptidase regulatory-like domain-containing protein [Sediminibacterium soli]NCI45822.1 TonB-dependent receptor [Sediminibacterium soli]